MLYDHLGRAVKTSSLRKEQSAPRVLGVRSHYELAAASPMSPERLARILRDAARGSIRHQSLLFEEMEDKDSLLFGEISKRKRAVSGSDWEVLPADDDARSVDHADFVRETFQNLELEDIHFDLLDAVGKGFSCVELFWDFSAGQGKVVRAEHRPQHWFRYGPNSDEIRLFDLGWEGEPLIPFKWIVHRHQAKSGSPYKGALFRVIAWLYLFRNYSLRAWVQFVESYGLPIRLAYYPSNTTEAEQQKLLSALASIASEACAIMPEGMSVDIRDQASNRNYSTPHKILLEWTGNQISIAIVGGILTSSADGKGASYALGEVHNQVRRDLQTSDARQLQTTMGRQLIKPLVDINYGPQAKYPRLRINLPKNEDREALSKVVQALAGVGFTEIPLTWIRDKFGIPKAGEGERILADLLKEAAPTGGKEDNKETNAFNMLAANSAGPQKDERDELVQALCERFDQTMHNDIIMPVVEVMASCHSFEEALAKLPAAFPDMNTDAFTRDLARAMFASGMYATGKDGGNRRG